MDHIMKFKVLLRESIAEKLTIYGIRMSKTRKFLGFEVYPTKEIRFEFEDENGKTSTVCGIKDLINEIPSIDSLFNERFQTEEPSQHFYPYYPEKLV